MAAAEREAVQFKLAARESELERMTNKTDRLIAAFEASSVRSDAREADLSIALSGARARVDELLTSRVEMLLEEGVAAQKLAESEKKRADLERALGESKLRAETSEKGVAIIVERVKAAENETVRLREQTELLYESNRVAKDVIERMRDEKEELEYQLATAKGKLAEAEGNRASVQSDLSGLESLASRLKTFLVKEKALKKLALDRLEQRKFDALPVLE
jgi:chromosome segregation ATPase